MDLMEVRRNIIKNQAHQMTVSGNMVTFNTDMVALLEITGTGNVTICGKNLFDELYTGIQESSTVYYYPVFVGNNTVTMSSTNAKGSGGGANLFLLAGNVSSGGSTSSNGVWSGTSRTVTAVNGYVTIAYRVYKGSDPRLSETMLAIGSSAVNYETYTGTKSSTLTGRKSIKGVNNVFSDNGNVTVKYWTH